MKKLVVLALLATILFSMCGCYHFEVQDITIEGMNGDPFTLAQVNCKYVGRANFGKAQSQTFRVKNRTKFVEQLAERSDYIDTYTNTYGDEYVVLFSNNNYYYLYEYAYFINEPQRNVFGLFNGLTVVFDNDYAICIPLYCQTVRNLDGIPEISLDERDYVPSTSMHGWAYWAEYYSRFTNGICEIDNDKKTVKVKGYVGEFHFDDYTAEGYTLSQDFVLLLSFTETDTGTTIDVTKLN